MRSVRSDKERRRRHGRSIDEAAKSLGASRSSTYPPERPAAEAGGEDDLTRLIRMIARQAAREAFNLVRDALEAPVVQLIAPAIRSNSKTGRKQCRKRTWSPEPGRTISKRRRGGREARRFAENGATNDRIRRLARASDRPARSSWRAQPCSLCHSGAFPEGYQGNDWQLNSISIA